MAETLLTILLVTSSAEKASVAFRWPSHPSSSPRLVRQRPNLDLNQNSDVPWRVSHFDSEITSSIDFSILEDEEGFNCEWRRPGGRPGRKSLSRHRGDDSAPGSGRNSPHTRFYDEFFDMEERGNPDYNDILGFTSQQLGRMLSPAKRSLFHQKFELAVDDLVFVGHPVCKEDDGFWKFKADDVEDVEEPLEEGPRGRDTTTKPRYPTVLEEPPPNKVSEVREEPTSALNSFHLVLVLDHPDPSSAGSGNLSKYYDEIYEHISIPVTAMLFQEQVLHSFVEKECHDLGELEEDCIGEGHSYEAFVSLAQAKYSIVRSMQALFASIKQSSIATIQLASSDMSFEIQLPPYLDSLLHTETDTDKQLDDQDDYEEDSAPWGPEMSFGWKLPALTPWKALLLLDIDGQDLLDSLRGKAAVSSSDMAFAQNLDRFLQEASLTLNLRDMGELLDWHLDTHVYPIVRWLVLHRRAKLVDVVHHSLKNRFAPAPKYPAPLSELSDAFEDAFEGKDVPPLPEILSRLSMGGDENLQTPNDLNQSFHSIFVKNKESIPIWFDVLTWLLRRDIIQALHLRVRVVVTREIKERVYDAALRRKEARLMRQREEAVKSSSSSGEDDGPFPISGAVTESFLNNRLPVTKVSRSPVPPNRRKDKRISIDFGIGAEKQKGRGTKEKEKHNSGTDSEDIERAEDEVDDQVLKLKNECDISSIIYKPGHATAVQRRWLKAMEQGKDRGLTTLFGKINPYFDGKKTDDEILFRAEISRKQLRHVLREFNEYLLAFLHS